MIPGEVIIKNNEITLNAGREITEIKVKNTGSRSVQVGSHFHFFETNKCLIFDKEKAFGKRLNIPSGTAVRFEAGEEKEILLVPISGEKCVFGLNDLTQGNVDIESTKVNAFEKAKKLGFKEDNYEL